MTSFNIRHSSNKIWIKPDLTNSVFKVVYATQEGVDGSRYSIDQVIQNQEYFFCNRA
jgi:hypothetical protein